jgi:DNA (cytosine-5)-methyltransferase 1
VLTSVDLFAGCGGLALGLKAAGIATSVAVENWPAAAQALGANLTNASVLPIDAKEFATAVKTNAEGFPRRGEIDLVVGGPPCQGFCSINRHRSIDDPRNSLVELFLECAVSLSPKVVLMENVNGILSLNKGKAIAEAMSFLEESGYKADFRILQAGCFGVPQNRWRVLLIGIKGDHPPLFPEPIHLFHRTVVFDAAKHKNRICYPVESSDMFRELLPELNVRDAIADLPEVGNGSRYEGLYRSGATSQYASMLRGSKSTVTHHECANLGPLNLKRVKCLKPDSGQGWTALPKALQPQNLVRFGGERFENRFGRLIWEKGFSTILTKPEPYWGRVIHPRQDRLISVRESARAQGFPDSAVFCGSLREKYQMVGNAVPPPLGRAAGWAIRKSLGDKDVDSEIEQYVHMFKA